MNEDAAISISWNRRMLARLVALYTVLCIIILPGIILFLGGTIYLALTKSWFSLLGLLETSVIIACLPFLLYYVSTLWRSLRQGEPAIIINKTGIADHVSNYMVGQLAWNEIQRMHPWTLEYRLLPNRFYKMPVVARHPGFVIVLKDKTYLQRLPRSKVLQIKIDNVGDNGRWIFISENFLDVTADELVRRINQFYTTQVRDAA